MNAMFSSVYLTKLDAYVMNLCMDIGNILLTMYFVIILASENYPHICTSRASQCSVRDKKNLRVNKSCWVFEPPSFS